MKHLLTLILITSLTMGSAFALSDNHPQESNVIEVDKLFELEPKDNKESKLVPDSPNINSKTPTISLPPKTSERSATSETSERSQQLRDLMGDAAFFEDLRLQGPVPKPKKPDPTWEPVVSEFSVTGLRITECCLRVIRSTRFAAEDACQALGRDVWQIESTRPQVTKKPYRYKGTCEVFLVSEDKKNTGYSCKARAVAKCITTSN